MIALLRDAEVDKKTQVSGSHILQVGQLTMVSCKIVAKQEGLLAQCKVMTSQIDVIRQIGLDEPEDHITR